METNPQRDLDIVERAAVAPWIDNPSPPRWWAATGGLLFGTLVFALGERGNLHTALWVIVCVVAVALLGAWIGWGQSRQGAVPRLVGAPPEFRSAIWGYLMSVAIGLVVVTAVFVLVDSRIAAMVAGLWMYLSLSWCERRSEAAVEALRARLG